MARPMTEERSRSTASDWSRTEAQPSRATALRRAQMELLKDRRYLHPGYWSPFLIISNWL